MYACIKCVSMRVYVCAGHKCARVCMYAGVNAYTSRLTRAGDYIFMCPRMYLHAHIHTHAGANDAE